MKVLVSAGDFSEAYGRLLLLDPTQQHVEILLEYMPPSNLSVMGKGFTGAAWFNQEKTSSKPYDLFVCGFSALYQICAKTWQVKAILHQACMNDLHHVYIEQNRLYLVNTGLDRIDCFDSQQGHFLGSYSLVPAWVTGHTLRSNSAQRPINTRWQTTHAFSVRHNSDNETTINLGSYYQTTDHLPFHQRKVQDCVHPNHITRVYNHLLVTRFRDRALQDIYTWEYILRDLPGYPHDGCVFENQFWLTTTNGMLLSYTFNHDHSLHLIPYKKIALFERYPYTGWCRGLLVTQDFVVVGLTRIAETNPVRWCSLNPAKTTTAILWLNRHSLALEAIIELNNLSAHPKVFSILPIFE